jgi:hypothetical protein
MCHHHGNDCQLHPFTLRLMHVACMQSTNQLLKSSALQLPDQQRQQPVSCAMPHSQHYAADKHA